VFRLLLAINLFLFNLYACKGGFEACKLKTIDSNTVVNQTLQIPVEHNQRLIFSTNRPSSKIIKHDPYLSLYLVEDSNKFKYPFRVNNMLSLGTAAVNSELAIEGKIIKKQIGLNSFAKYSEPLFAPSLLLNSCCALEGIVTPEGIIEKEYIDRFLKIKKVSYSDIGIRVEDQKNHVIVRASNPFMKNNPFLKDDYILAFDGKKVKDSASLMRDILFSKIGSTHKLTISRDSKILTLSVKSQNRDGGGYLSDTFLEFLGVSFDKNLSIVKIENRAKKYALKLGDRLLQVNTTDIKNEQDILEIINNSKKSTNLLFQRKQFQFFVKIN